MLPFNAAMQMTQLVSSRSPRKTLRLVGQQIGSTNHWPTSRNEENEKPFACINKTDVNNAPQTGWF